MLSYDFSRSPLEFLPYISSRIPPQTPSGSSPGIPFAIYAKMFTEFPSKISTGLPPETSPGISPKILAQFLPKKSLRIPEETPPKMY